MPSFQKLAVTVTALVSLGVACLIVVFPAKGLEAATRGVAIWWDVLFPALFPFFVISEMMLGFGIVHFFGALLDPMMRPLFRVPGIGGFVMAMGFASGYPIGARLTSQLWEQKLVNRDEGERLVSFTSTSDPIFLIGAVSVGFFHDAGLAVIFALSHYGTGIVLGLIMRFHGSSAATPPAVHQDDGPIMMRALRAMHRARLRDGRPVGLLLQEAVQSSLKLVFVIGGLVVFFSAVLELFTAAHVMDFFYRAVNAALHLFAIPEPLSQAVVNGFFEVTLGAKSAGSAGDSIALVHKVAIAAFVLSWSGLSVHAQIVSLLNHTNLRYVPFLAARFTHGVLAAAAVYVMWNPLQPLRETLSYHLPAMAADGAMPYMKWMFPAAAFVFTAVLVVIAVLFAVYRSVKWLNRFWE